MSMRISENTKNLLQHSLICDLALGFEPEIEVPHKWETLKRYKKSGFNYVGLAIAGEFTNLEKTIHFLAKHKQKILQEPNYLFVNNSDDLFIAKQNNKLALSFWLQGSAPLGNDVNMIEVYYQLGVRYMLLCYNTKNSIGDGCAEKTDGGLSNFGIEVVKNMNRTGMLIDCSHGGFETTMEIMEISKSPVIFSHSNAFAIHNHPRNLQDTQIKALAKTGGVIGINGLSMLLGSEDAPVEKALDHIDYIANLVGPEHISLGLDLVYFQEILNLFFDQAGTTYPKGYVTSHNLHGIQPENLAEIIELLQRRGYQEPEIKGILGENFLRVAKSVWR